MQKIINWCLNLEKWRNGSGSSTTVSVTTSEATGQWTSRECQYTLHPHLAWTNMLHPPPTLPERSDIFTVKVMILDTRNERTPARPVDSGISLMNLTRKPCWHKEEGFRDEWHFKKKSLPTPPKSTAKMRRVGVGQVGWLLSWAGCCSYRRPQLPSHSGAAALGQEPLLVMYSETKLP